MPEKAENTAGRMPAAFPEVKGMVKQGSVGCQSWGAKYFFRGLYSRAVITRHSTMSIIT